MEPKTTIRIGLCGFGNMGKVHAFAIQSLPYYYADLPFRAEVFGVSTRSDEKSDKIAKEYGFPFVVASEDSLLKRDKLDVIDVCTPNICHKDTILNALRAGKHVLSEKPLASTLPDALILKDAEHRANQAGLVTGTVFNNRFLAPVLRAKQLINEGALGRILSFRADYKHNSCLFPEKNAGWKQDASVCGEGGVLFDLGSHVIDLVSMLCGDFDSVSSVSQIAFPFRKGLDGTVWETDASEAFYLIGKLKNGAVGTVTASKLSMGSNDDLSFEISGTEGALRFSLMDPNYLYFYNGKLPSLPVGGYAGFTAIECVGRYPAPGGIFPSPKAPDGWIRGHIESMYRFLSAVYTAKTNASGVTDVSGLFRPSFSDAASVQAVMAAALESARTGKTVRISEETP